MKPTQPRRSALALPATLLVLLSGFGAAQAADAPQPQSLQTLTISRQSAGTLTSHDAVVEALRQTVVAAQVAGAIVQLDVKAGDRVKAGQVLMRIDARAAEQAATASEAQAQSARAALQLAGRELDRQQQLFRQHYISQAALDQAEAQFKATQAQLNAQLAQAGLARTQSSFNLVRSPYDGVIAELPVSLGDMALPGRALATVYDPSALRVTANVPQSLGAGVAGPARWLIEIPGVNTADTPIVPTGAQLLPLVDASSHTLQLRLNLPAKLTGVVPGMFARVLVPGVPGAAPALRVPRSAIVRRAELTGLYVLDAKGVPLLRQVRLGAAQGESVEVLSGLAIGERVVLDSAAAARIR